MKASTAITLHYSSRRRLEMILKVLKPEAESHPSTRRSKVKVSSKENCLILSFEAEDTSALRAAINSYMRWIMLINDSLKTIEELNK